MFSKIRNPYLRSICKFLASLRLAVTVILGIGVLSAYGTIVEAQYDAITAQKLVYHSWWSYGIFGCLIVNLVAVMVDRWPWKKRHIGFLMAHVGIIILLGGSLLTRYFGIDGNMRIAIGESKSHITLPATDEISLWATLDGTSYTKILEEPLKVDFLVNPPTKTSPFELLEGKIKFIDYIPYALKDVKVQPSIREADGPAVRFVLENERVNITDWLVLSAQQKDEVRDLGPAQLIFSKLDVVPVEGNAIVLKPEKDGLHYTVYTESNPGRRKTGILKAGESMNTGWMDLTLRILNYHERAQYKVEYRPVKRPSPKTTSAARVLFNDKEYELGLNSHLQLFDESKMFVLGYGNRLIPLDFSVKLKEFRVGRYQGTLRAASYESLVEIPIATGSNGGVSEAQAKTAQPGETREVLIYMNEPLKHRGLTFYQASFEEDEMGEPTASILAVNYDPGRYWKYLGSLMIVFGVFHLFYSKARKMPVAK